MIQYERSLLIRQKNGHLSQRVRDIFDDIYSFDEFKVVDSLINFRPTIYCHDKIPIYCTQKYDTILNNFLGRPYTRIGLNEKIINPEDAIGKFKWRQDFLDRFVNIEHHKRGWELITFPDIYTITFDKSLKRARIYFGDGEGIMTILKKEGQEWKIVGTTMTWIE